MNKINNNDDEFTDEISSNDEGKQSDLHKDVSDQLSNTLSDGTQSYEITHSR